jgi:hypothetical protein
MSWFPSNPEFAAQMETFAKLALGTLRLHQLTQVSRKQPIQGTLLEVLHTANFNHCQNQDHQCAQHRSCAEIITTSARLMKEYIVKPWRT